MNHHPWTRSVLDILSPKEYDTYKQLHSNASLSVRNRPKNIVVIKKIANIKWNSVLSAKVKPISISCSFRPRQQHMAVSNFRKFRLLLWKNYVLQRRHIAQTVLELLLPLVFITILVVVRVLLDPKIYEDGKTFRPFNPISTDGNRIGENLQQSGNPYEDKR